jgi:ribonuclease VapC
MVVDTSVVVAIVRNEDDASIWIDVLDRSDGALMSIVSYVETNMVIAGRRKDFTWTDVDDLLGALGIELVGVTVEDGTAALDAFRRFGKGRHPARLNFSDCFAYGLAKSRGLSLLFKGEDFAQTDIVPAWKT